MTSDRSALCIQCVAKAGLASSRCERCEDYSAFECGPYRMSDLADLSARGKLAFVLAELATLKRIEEADHDEN